MLQVGVDVSRLGLMMVTGQPKNSAEYIQASSRVGRTAERPGLVVTLFNWARPRDLAHLETFTHFHETFYARVEPLSVTPFADRALDRGLAAVLVAVIRHSRADWEREPGAHQVPVSNDEVDAAVQWIAERAGAVLGDATKMADIDATCRVLMDEWDRRRKGLEVGSLSYTSAKDGMDPLLDAGARTWGTWSAGWSLREVEPETNLLINLAAPEVADRPDWGFGDVPSPASSPAAGGLEDDLDQDSQPVDELGLLTAEPVSVAEGAPLR